MPGFSGQGKVLSGLRLASGLPDILRWWGNADQFDVQFSQDVQEKNESFSGSRLPFRRLTRTRGATINIRFDEASKENWALSTNGVATTVAAGAPQTNVPLAATVGNPAKVGDFLALPAKNVSGVVIKDSTGVPKTLVADVNYRLDAFAATIEILDLTAGGPWVMPLTADFTPGQVVVMGAFKTPELELYMRMDGVNTDDGSRAIVDVYRARLSTAQLLKFISNDLNDFELNGTMLADPTRQVSAVGGQFFSLTTPS